MLGPTKKQTSDGSISGYHGVVRTAEVYEDTQGRATGSPCTGVFWCSTVQSVCFQGAGFHDDSLR